jgi:uncharacterized protein (DUF2147 family)
MKTFFLAAATAFLMTSTADAGSAISFQIEGQRIYIAQPKGCNSLSCIEINAPGLSGKSFNLKSLNLDGFKKDSDDGLATAAAPATPQATPAPAAPTAQASQPPAPAASIPPPPPPPPAPAPPAAGDAAPASSAQAVDPPPAPQPTQVATAAPLAQPPAATAPSAPATPIGLWATEENKGNVRIEQCGANLCGYAEKTGERILINMKPENSKWVGRIHDPNGGGNYDSTIAMKTPNVLKVQGCAFGGMFCGGQTWKRVS